MSSFLKKLFSKKTIKYLPEPKVDDIYTQIIESLRNRSLKTLDDYLNTDNFQINEFREEYNNETRDPWTLLMRIASEFDSKFLLYLLDDYKAKVDIMTPKNGHTALILSVKNGMVHNVRTLCIYHCNKDITDNTVDGNSALHYACILGNIEIVQILIGNIGKKANLNVMNSHGKTPLDLAKFYGRDDICNMLESEICENVNPVKEQRGNEQRNSQTNLGNYPIPTEHSEANGTKPKKRSQKGNHRFQPPSSSEEEQNSLTATKAIQETSQEKQINGGYHANLEDNANNPVYQAREVQSLYTRVPADMRDSAFYSKENLPITVPDHTNVPRQPMEPRLTAQNRAYSYTYLDKNFPMDQVPFLHGNKY